MNTRCMRDKEAMPLQITLLSRNKMNLGICLILLGILLPLWITVDSMHVHEVLFGGLAADNQAQLLEAAFRLVMVNTVRGIPHYLGAFILAEAFIATFDGKQQRWVNVFTVVILIACVYQIIGILYDIHYDMGVPALTLMAVQLTLWRLNYSYIGLIKKTSLIVVFLTGLQFLDVMPMLDGLPFGRGETSQDIKLGAELLHMESFLDSAMLICFFSCMSVTVLLFVILRDENHMMEIRVLKDQNEQIALEARISDLENRSTQELQHLVHDLKTPLTSIQTLAFVVKLRCAGDEHEETRECLTRIEGSVDHMSNMISEILYEHYRAKLETEQLLNMVLAQLSACSYADAITSENQSPDAVVCVNSIRMARTIINLAENAHNAQSEARPFRLHIAIDSILHNEIQMVRIRVADNGVGIEPEHMKKIWTRGVSYRGSSGLGMAFVRDMVLQSNGDIQIESTVDVGTTVTLFLPLGDENIE